MTYNSLPTYGSPNPTNRSTGQPLELIWTIPISDADGDLLSWQITCNNSQTNSGNNDTNGIKHLILTNLTNGTTYYIWVNTTDDFDTIHQWYQFTTRSGQTPSPPTAFTAIVISATQINLSWIKGTHADMTYIEWNSVPTWNQGDGFLLSNTTGTTVIHSNLSGHTTYYYQAWSWNETDKVYSTVYATTNATTYIGTTLYIYGLAEYCNGGNADGALVEVSSLYGTIVTFVGPIGGWGSGYWQVNAGDPSTNWHVGTNFSVQIREISTGWQSAIMDEILLNNGTDMGMLILESPPIIAMASADTILAALGDTIQFYGAGFGGATPYLWHWNFGDGTESVLENPSHVYNSLGNYSVTLTVIEDCGKPATDLLIIRIVNPINITVNGTFTATVNETIIFNASVQGGTPPFYSYWDFGDNSSSTNQTTTHIYTEPGVYTVVLLVTDAIGLQETFETTIIIYTDNLHVSANGPYEGIEEEIVYFNGVASHGVEPYNWSWTFGDGSTETIQNPQHTYQHNGNYTVTLTVTDTLGTSTSVSTYVLISKPPYLIIEIDGPYNSVVGVAINFSATVLEGTMPYTWVWTFGDGATSTAAVPVHIFTIPGEYLVNVQVTDVDQRIGMADTIVTIRQNYPPAKPTISGTFRGKAGSAYMYEFSTHDPDGNTIYYYVDWGDGTNSGWIGPYESNKMAEISHLWRYEDTYLIKVKAKDIFGAESDWTTNEVIMPYLPHILIWFEQLIDRFPFLELFLVKVLSLLP